MKKRKLKMWRGTMERELAAINTDTPGWMRLTESLPEATGTFRKIRYGTMQFKLTASKPRMENGALTFTVRMREIRNKKGTHKCASAGTASTP